MSQVSGEDVAEIASGDDEDAVLSLSFRKSQPSVNVVHTLGEDPGEVDGVDCGEAVLFAKILIGKDILHGGLAIIKCALNGDRKDGIRSSAGHLAFLKRGNTAVWIKNEDGHAFASEKTVNGRRAGVSGGSSEYSNRVSCAANLFFVKIAKHLEGEVFEGESGTMKEFENMEVVRKGLERSDGRIGEAVIGTMTDGPKGVFLNVGGEEFEKLKAEVGIAESFPMREFVRNGGQAFRQVESGVGCQSSSDSFRKANRWGFASGADVFHVFVLGGWTFQSNKIIKNVD